MTDVERISDAEPSPVRSGRPRRRRFLLLVCGAIFLPAAAACLYSVYSRAVEARAHELIQELGGETRSVATTVLLPGIAPDSIINRYFARFTTRVRLNSLEIPGQTITDDDLALFVDVFPCLATLNMPSSEITDESLSALATLPHLQRLDVSGSQITDAGLVELQQSESLRLLIASDTHITGAGAEALEAAVPGCIVLR